MIVMSRVLRMKQIRQGMSLQGRREPDSMQSRTARSGFVFCTENNEKPLVDFKQEDEAIGTVL